MLQMARARQTSVRRNSHVSSNLKTITDEKERKMALSVIGTEMETLGLNEKYVERLKELRNKMDSFTKIELSEKEARLFVSIVEAFCVLEGQKWSAAKINSLGVIYRNLGGSQNIEEYWLFWKKLSVKNDMEHQDGNKFCPRCGQKIK